MDKNLIRKTVLSQRKALSALEKSQAESVMMESLLNWEVFKNAGVIHIFISKPDEPDTRPIIEHCWSFRKKIAVPVVLPDTFELFHSEIKSFDDLINCIESKNYTLNSQYDDYGLDYKNTKLFFSKNINKMINTN